jgi:aspartyl-tRNA(Asn)/glutamyl-tRNA(Gln) amidotransferase subunit A
MPIFTLATMLIQQKSQRIPLRQVRQYYIVTLKSADRITGKETVTVAIKDNIATTHNSTTCASGILEDYVSPYRASVVRSLLNSNSRFRYDTRSKTNMDEFGMGSHSTNSYFGPVKNKMPFPQRSAGGSSGGSAVAVATNSSKAALGTDTGGSVRLPAAYTQTVGFKPSYGRLSRNGVIPYANSLDTVGIFAKKIGRIESEMSDPSSLYRIFQRVDKYDPRDPTSLTDTFRKRMSARQPRLFYHREVDQEEEAKCDGEKKRFRIGVPLEYNIEELEETVRNVWKTLLQMLEYQGHKIIPVSLPSTKHALSAYYVLAAAEATSNLAKYDGVRYGVRTEGSDGAGNVLYANTRGKGFGEEVKRRILLGSYTLSSEAMDNHFIQAQKVRRLVQRDFDRVFAMPNPLRPKEQFDLSEMDGDIELENKRGPPQVDVLLCPTAPTLPPLLEDVKNQSPLDAYMNDVFTVPASLAGLPAVSVPVKILREEREEDNVPYTGMQVIGQYYDDYQVLKFGRLIERLGAARALRDGIKKKPTSPSSRRGKSDSRTIISEN